LLQAVRIAESHGFKVLHGIRTHCGYTRKIPQEKTEKIRDEITKTTGFEMSLDIYKWPVFLSSKEHEMIPVAIDILVYLNVEN